MEDIMKKIVLIYVFVILAMTLYAQEMSWSEFQQDIGIQAAQFRNSPEHIFYRQQKQSRSYIVGDTKTFWRWNLAVMPPTWIQTPSTCRAVGAHSYIFVADSEWNVRMTQAHVDTIMVRLEQNTPNNPNMGAIMMDVNLFGPIPDELDNDPKLIVFYSALGSFNNTSFDGYFSAYNQVTEAQAQMMNPPGHSNECEMIYMTCHPLNPVAPIRLSVLAHELQHLIHWGQDANEETWLNEGCAELAMVAYGIPDPITMFNNNPDNNLTAWNQQFADYVKVMLFFTYLQEHFDATGMIRDIVADPLNGMTSLSGQLAIHHPGLALNNLINLWACANFIDAPQPLNGIFNYQQLTLPNFAFTNMNVYPSQSNLTINSYAADYLQYAPSQGVSSFSMMSTGMVYIRVLLFNQLHECYEVIEVGTTDFYELNPIPDGTFYAVFVLSTTASPVSYFYAATTVENSDEVSPALDKTTLTCYPNPCFSKTNISYRLKESSHVKLAVYNVKGQLVSTLVDDDKSASSNSILWTGTDDKGQPLPAGVYYVRLQTGSGTKIHKILLNR